MRTVFIALLVGYSFSAWSHDGGHGPKLKDAAPHGGVVSSVVVRQSPQKRGAVGYLYKSELLRSEDGTVRVYFYDKQMNSLDLSRFESDAKGVVEFKKNKKWNHHPFSLKNEDGVFIGKAPQVGVKPFNIDIQVKEGSKNLLAAFDNLD